MENHLMPTSNNQLSLSLSLVFNSDQYHLVSQSPWAILYSPFSKKKPLHLFNLSLCFSMSTESCTVETSDGIKLHTRFFKPQDPKSNLAIIIVHPYSIMGGCQALMRGIAVGLAEKGYRAITFDMRGAGRSKGRPSLTGSSEILDVIAVCRWAVENTGADRILLVGSSAGIDISFFLSTFSLCRLHV